MKLASPPRLRTDGPLVPLLEQDACWRRLPTVKLGGGTELPNWTLAVAVNLPRTAAAMLELDYAQRVKNPLDPVLRGKMRWVIARENRCDYSQAYAIADLQRAGLDDAGINVLTGPPENWPEADREPLEFARLLTVAAPTVPDALFERLRRQYGENRVAAMVLVAAYGNFQDRLVLGLNLPLEEDGPLPPLAVSFDEEAFQIAPMIPPQDAPPEAVQSGQNVAPQDPEWLALTYDDLQTRLERQRDRQPRLPIPSWESVKPKIPPAMAARPTRIVWNLVGHGYVSELSVPWSIATRTLWAEAKGNRVFEESLFWIQTRTIECNYCMGHCEMLLEVAGLDQVAIAERTRQLAGSDWSAFPPEEQRAFAFARKLTKTPWLLTAADYQSLVDDLGPDKAMATFWWLCRGLYMTRVSDGFQLPLERDNVFQPAPAPLDAAGLERLSKLSPEEIEKLYSGGPRPEAVTMLLAVLRGSMMGPGEGWFGPAKSQYSWQWLARRCGVSADGTISAEAFPGSTLHFSRLDRNQDGLIDAEDLDWSAKNPWVQQGYLMHRLFRRMNPEGSGQLTREQWLAFFEEAKGDKDYLTAEDIRDAFLRGTSGGMFAGDMPKQEVLIRGMITGELGSFHEGPAIGERAPDFSLSTHDGAKKLSLAQVIGDKPVVLVFGNFTCPPFRAMYQGVEEVFERFRGQAELLAVYVREAHPTDGWCMASNDRVGVRTRQPATYGERVSVASRCHQLLHLSIPLLVDDIHDPVGSAYSGMPARLYVLDREGRVAYQSGRGPFGFKVGEMEQALIMSLLDQ